MIITREVDYSIRLIRAMQDGEIHSMKPLCQEEEIPWKFAYQIIRKLRDAGLFRTYSGVRGGCQLIRKPSDITLLTVLRALDDRCFVSACVENGYECEWVKKKQHPCNVHTKLCAIERALETTFAGITMEDLLSEKSLGSVTLDLSCRTEEKRETGGAVLPEDLIENPGVS